MTPYLVITKVQGFSRPLRFCMLLDKEQDADIRLTEKFGHRLIGAPVCQRLDVPAKGRRKDEQ